MGQKKPQMLIILMWQKASIGMYFYVYCGLFIPELHIAFVHTVVIYDTIQHIKVGNSVDPAKGVEPRWVRR